MGIAEDEPFDLAQQQPADPAALQPIVDRHAPELPRRVVLPGPMQDRDASDHHVPVVQCRKMNGPDVGIPFEDRRIARQAGAQHTMAQTNHCVRVDDAQLRFLSHLRVSVVEIRTLVTPEGPWDTAFDPIRREKVETKRAVSMNHAGEGARAIATIVANRVRRSRIRCMAARNSAR